MLRNIGYKLTSFLVSFCDFCLTAYRPKKNLSYPCFLSLRKIWEQASHSAFTDLIFYRNKFFCVFREADTHAGGAEGVVRILASEDGSEWQLVSTLKLSGIDLRDPHFSIMPDGRLFLIMGGSVYQGEKLLTHRPYVTFSNDGANWTPIEKTDLEREWVWRVTWHGEIGYGMSYRLTDLEDIEQPWLLKLFKTTDGINYQYVTQLDVSSHPSEATVRFLPDDTMVALVRRDGNGWIGSAKAPYRQWNWKEIGYRLGGPNFLILPDGQMWAASRLVKVIDKKTKETSTILARMSLKEYEPLLQFPSGGDTSYPGMVYRNGKLYISYYSSHEGKSAIYFAEVGFLPFNINNLGFEFSFLKYLSSPRRYREGAFQKCGSFSDVFFGEKNSNN